ncbi:MAG: cell division protein FtsZ, partial [Fimbriimonadaceae bacterium]
VMQNAGPALMGIGYGVGDQRALQAAQSATNSLLLEQTITGAKGLLVNITAGDDLTLNEASEAMNYIQSMCDETEASIYFGTVVDDSLDGAVRITVLATGFNPYTAEGRAVTQATYGEPAAEAVSPTPDPMAGPTQQSAPAHLPKIEPRKPFSFPNVNITEKAASRSGQQDTSEVFDESDLDIPAFIREHRKRQEKA